VVPSHHPLEGLGGAGRRAGSLGLGCLPFAIVLMMLPPPDYRTFGGMSLLVTVACVQLPLGVLAACKVGAT